MSASNAHGCFLLQADDRAAVGVLFHDQTGTHQRDGGQSPVAESTIHFTARKDGKNLCWGTIYIQGTPIEDSGTMLYTATLVGTGLVMEQNPDGGAVIRLR